jgi:hypothetical protein
VHPRRSRESSLFVVVVNRPTTTRPIVSLLQSKTFAFQVLHSVELAEAVTHARPRAGSGSSSSSSTGSSREGPAGAGAVADSATAGTRPDDNDAAMAAAQAAAAAAAADTAAPAATPAAAKAATAAASAAAVQLQFTAAVTREMLVAFLLEDAEVRAVVAEAEARAGAAAKKKKKR